MAQAMRKGEPRGPKRLAARPDSASRWVGKDAFRELTSPGVQRRLAKHKVRAAGA